MELARAARRPGCPGAIPATSRSGSTGRPRGCAGAARAAGRVPPRAHGGHADGPEGPPGDGVAGRAAHPGEAARTWPPRASCGCRGRRASVRAARGSTTGACSTWRTSSGVRDSSPASRGSTCRCSASTESRSTSAAWFPPRRASLRRPSFPVRDVVHHDPRRGRDAERVAEMIATQPARRPAAAARVDGGRRDDGSGGSRRRRAAPRPWSPTGRPSRPHGAAVPRTAVLRAVGAADAPACGERGSRSGQQRQRAPAPPSPHRRWSERSTPERSTPEERRRSGWPSPEVRSPERGGRPRRRPAVSRRGPSRPGPSGDPSTTAVPASPAGPWSTSSARRPRMRLALVLHALGVERWTAQPRACARSASTWRDITESARPLVRHSPPHGDVLGEVVRPGPQRHRRDRFGHRALVSSSSAADVARTARRPDVGHQGGEGVVVEWPPRPVEGVGPALVVDRCRRHPRFDQLDPPAIGYACGRPTP